MILEYAANTALPPTSEPTAEDLERIGNLLRHLAGQDVHWDAQQSLNVWAMEQRARLDQRMSERIRTISWALVAAPIGLVVCTVFNSAEFTGGRLSFD